MFGHRFDLLHPIDDTENFARQMPNASFVPSSPVGLRALPDASFDTFREVLGGIWGDTDTTIAA